MHVSQLCRYQQIIRAGSVAFPAVSAGIYGWPIDGPADVAVQTVASTSTAVEDTRLMLFNDEALAQLRRAHDELGHERRP